GQAEGAGQAADQDQVGGGDGDPLGGGGDRQAGPGRGGAEGDGGRDRLWRLTYQLAGLVGVDPGPHTLRELVWMAEGKVEQLVADLDEREAEVEELNDGLWLGT